jgi:hypothetical protein
MVAAAQASVAGKSRNTPQHQRSAEAMGRAERMFTLHLERRCLFQRLDLVQETMRMSSCCCLKAAAATCEFRISTSNAASAAIILLFEGFVGFSARLALLGNTKFVFFNEKLFARREFPIFMAFCAD